MKTRTSPQRARLWLLADDSFFEFGLPARPALLGERPGMVVVQTNVWPIPAAQEPAPSSRRSADRRDRRDDRPRPCSPGQNCSPSAATSPTPNPRRCVLLPGPARRRPIGSRRAEAMPAVTRPRQPGCRHAQALNQDQLHGAATIPSQQRPPDPPDRAVKRSMSLRRFTAHSSLETARAA